MRKVPIARLVLAMFLLLLLGGIGWISAVIFGNPLVLLTMKGRVTDYLGNRYPDTAFIHERTIYDFLNRRYVVRMRPAGQPDVEFRVTFGRKALQGRDDYRETVLAREAEAQFAPVVLAVLPGSTVNAATVASDSDQPGLATGISVSVSWESSSAEPEAFVDQAMKLLAACSGRGLQADEYHFWCTVGEDRNLALTVVGGPEQISKAELLELVVKPGKW